MHAITQIRKALVAAVTGLPTSGSRVFETRAYPTGDDVLPCLVIYTLDDKLSRQGDQRRRIQVRELACSIEARRKCPADGAIDAGLEEMVMEVQEALGSDRTLGGLVLSVVCGGVQFKVDDLEVPVGVADMAWVCRYLVAESDPETLIGATAP
jgi:hypothetical protein